MVQMSKFEADLDYAFIMVLLVIGLWYVWLATGTQMLGEDEGLYYSVAKSFSHGEYPVAIGLNPTYNILPFGPLMHTVGFMLGGPSLAAAKAISVLFAVLTLLLLYAIGRKHNVYFGIFAALTLVTVQLFDHLALQSYLDVPIVFFSLLIVYMMSRLRTLTDAAALGAVFVLAYYTKSSVIALAGVLALAMLFQLVVRRNVQYVKLGAVVLAILAIGLLPFAARNIVLYSYPAVEGLNMFFKFPWPAAVGQYAAEWTKTISAGQLSLSFFISAFGWLATVLGIFGFTWLVANRFGHGKQRDIMTLATVSILIFMAGFVLELVTGGRGVEPRYLSVIYPQLALLGGFFLWKAKEWNKVLLLIIVPMLLSAVWSGVAVAQMTHDSQRYTADYVEAMQWVKANTPADASVFTTYGGSLLYYGDRNWVWMSTPCMLDSFVNVMTTQNGSYIYDSLKACNVSYILIWSSTVASQVIIPKSNIWGAFTYNFVDVVRKDTEHFNTTYQNQNNIILKVL